MKWTRTKPTVEGYYFKRHDGKDVVVRQIVYRRSFDSVKSDWRVCQDRNDECGWDLNIFNPNYTEWAGPIEMPQE